MNFCNFGKVIIARATKDITTLKWWEDQRNLEKPAPVYTTNLTLKQRYENYQMYMSKYPKMHLTFTTFTNKTSRIEKYIYEKKHWKHNKNGEQKEFLNHFSLHNWVNTNELEKFQHSIENCRPCNTIHLNFSQLHDSISQNSYEIHQQCQSAAENLAEVISPTSSTKEKGLKVIKSIVNIIQPLVEQKVNINFDHNLADHLTTLQPYTPKEQQKVIEKTIKESKHQFELTMEDNGDDVTNFLASGKSYNQYNRDRLTSCFESRQHAERRVNNNDKTTRKHHGNFDTYQFDKENFLKDMRKKQTGEIVNWTKLARDYDVKVKGKFPLNGGQVLQEFCRHNGLNFFKPQTKDYLRRVRRAKKVVRIRQKRVTLPAPRTIREIKNTIKEKIHSGELYVGEKVAPKEIIKTKISKNGELEQETMQLYGRKIPLDKIRTQTLQHHQKQGILRLYTDDHYDSMTKDEIETRLAQLKELPLATTDTSRHHLKSLERTRKMKMWHDHSDILNHSYVLFTVSMIYDEANFLTDEEYRHKYPHKKPLCIQSVVEQPQLYIFGQSACTDTEQASYSETRLQDLQILPIPIDAENNIKIYDVLRVFSGDGPARQFESGQQRGGNYSCVCGVPASDHGNLVRCYQMPTLSLTERCNLISSSTNIDKIKSGHMNPFQNLRKEDLIDELENRNIDTSNMLRQELQEQLTTILHGICRPPALMLLNPTKSAEDLNIGNYEVLGVEPLHDLTNVIQNIITELPLHISEKSVQKEFEKFAATTIGDKTKIKGSDARLFLVQMAKFTSNLYEDKKIGVNIVQLIESLVEITNICYSKYSTRSPKQILRLHNQCFLFAILCRSIIGVPKKLTSRRFFGSHFHSLTIHAPETLRIFNIRSIITEKEERSFGTLRRISENTTNRQPEWVCDNAIIRFTSQNSTDESLRIQESTISRQAQLLKDRTNSTIPKDLVANRPVLLQEHLKRICDFLDLGQGTWWQYDDQGNLEFFDGPNEPDSRPDGPQLHHFRTYTLKDEKDYLKRIWKNVVDKFENNKLILPLRRVRVFVDDDDTPMYITPKRTDMDEDEDEGNHDIIGNQIETDAASNSDKTDALQSKEQEKQTDEMTSKDTLHTDLINKIHDTTMNNEHILDKGQDREDRNTIKEKYKSFIKVVKWTEKSRPYQIHCPSENQKLTGIEQKQQPKSCKRKLFQTDIPVGSHLGTSTGTRTTDVIKDIVGSTPEYENYAKYRRMSKTNPSDKSIRQNFERWEAKIQIQVSKQRSHLKEKENPSLREQQLTKQSEELLKKWGIYYY